VLGDTVACIQYHTWWPGGSDPFYLANVTENTARTNYYQPGSKYVPRAFIDGILDGGSSYSMWGNFIRGRAIVDAPVKIDLEGSFSAPNGLVRVLVEATDFLSYSDLRIFAVITESGIFFNAPNGTTIHNQTMRDMLPNSSGDPVSLMSPGDTLLREYSFIADVAWEIPNCDVVVFLQDNATKEILQAASQDILSLGIEESAARGSRIARLELSTGYPNPFKERAQVRYSIPSSGHVGLRVYDSAGNLVRTLLSGDAPAGTYIEYWDGRDESGRELASGVYFSRLSFGGETRVSRITLLR
jgi:hypothetical protein